MNCFYQLQYILLTAYLPKQQPNAEKYIVDSINVITMRH